MMAYLKFKLLLVLVASSALGLPSPMGSGKGGISSILSVIVQGKTHSKTLKGEEDINSMGELPVLTRETLAKVETAENSNGATAIAVLKEIARRKQAKRFEEAEGEEARESEVPNFGQDAQKREDLGLDAIPDVVLEENLRNFREKVRQECEATSSGEEYCSSEILNTEAKAVNLREKKNDFCVSKENLGKCSSTKDKLVDDVENIFNGLVEGKPGRTDVDTLFADLDCYPPICDKLDTVEQEISRLDEAIQNQGPCKKKICDVSDEDFVQYVAISQDTDGKAKIFGTVVAQLETLDISKVTSDDVERIRNELSLSSTDDRALSAVFKDGNIEDLSEGDKNKIFGKILDAVQKECTKNAFAKAEECTSEDLKIGKTIQDRNQILEDICNDKALEDCPEIDEEETQKTLKETRKKEEDMAPSEIASLLPRCKPANICRDRSIVNADESIPYCRPKVCDIKSTEDIIAFANTKTKEKKGLGNYRFISMLQHMKTDEDAERLGQISGLSAPVVEGLKQMLRGDELTEENERVLAQAIYEKKEMECKEQAPATSTDMLCSERKLNQGVIAMKLGRKVKMACSDGADSLDACQSDSEAKQNLDMVFAAMRGEKNPEELPELCSHRLFCDEVKKEFDRRRKPIFCRHPLCDANAKIIAAKLKSIVGSGGPRSGPKQPLRSITKVASFVQSFAALTSEARDKEIEDFGQENQLTSSEASTAKLIFNADRTSDLSPNERDVMNKIFDLASKECQNGVSTAAAQCSDEEVKEEIAEVSATLKVCEEKSFDKDCESADEKDQQSVMFKSWLTKVKQEARGTSQARDASTGTRYGSDALANPPPLRCKPMNLCEQLITKIQSKAFDKNQCRKKVCDIAAEDREDFLKLVRNNAKNQGVSPSSSMCATNQVLSRNREANLEYIKQRKAEVAKRREGTLYWYRVSDGTDQCDQSRVSTTNEADRCTESEVENGDNECFQTGKPSLGRLCEIAIKEVWTGNSFPRTSVKVCFLKKVNDGSTYWAIRTYSCNICPDVQL